MASAALRGAVRCLWEALQGFEARLAARGHVALPEGEGGRPVALQDQRRKELQGVVDRRSKTSAFRGSNIIPLKELAFLNSFSLVLNKTMIDIYRLFLSRQYNPSFYIELICIGQSISGCR